MGVTFAAFVSILSLPKETALLTYRFTWAKRPVKSVKGFFQANKDLLVTCQSTKAVSSVKSAVSHFHPTLH